MPEQRPPDAVHHLDVRTVLVLGHAGSGKTTLVHALCGKATPGVATPTTALTLHSAHHEGTGVRLLDTPGHCDLVGAVRAGLHAADVALFVVSAVDGLDAASALLWQECESLDLRRVVAVTKIDQPRADFEETFALCRRVLGADVVATHLPLHADDESVAGLLDLLRQQIIDYSLGTLPHRRPADPEHQSLIEAARADLVEAVLAHADDDALLDRYLADDPVEPHELVAHLRFALTEGALQVVLPVAIGSEVRSPVGGRELLDVLTGDLPGPRARHLPPLWAQDGNPRPPLSADPDGPPVAQVVATTSGVGEARQALVRVLSGTLHPGQPLSVARHGRLLTDPLTWPGPRCAAGDVCAVVGLAATTMDTLSSPDEPGMLDPWPLPDPTAVVALRSATSSGPDDGTLAAAVRRVALDDPTVRVEAAGDGTVLRVMGERHLAVVVERLAALGVQVGTRLIDQPLRETFTRPARGTAEVDGLRADVDVVPGGAGSGLVVQAPAGLEPLVREAAAAGVLAGYPLTDIRLELVAPPDARAAPALRAALCEAATRGAPALLEPVEVVSVEVDNAYLEAVTRDLSIRRGRVSATTAVGSGRTRVRADVPASSLSRYAVDLRALAHGTAELTRTSAGWAPLPMQFAERIIATRGEPDA